MNLKILGASAALAVLILDQATKIAVLQNIGEGEAIGILPFFNLVMVWNRGISFGLFNHGAPLPPILFAAVSTLIAGAFVLWLTKAENRLISLAAGLVIGGAAGNVVDRLRLGAVVDFLDFHIGSWHWPAFNVADSAICVGIALIVFDGLFLGSLGSRKLDVERHEEKHAD